VPFSAIYTVQKEEPVRLILLMQRENILYMTDTIGCFIFGGFLRVIQIYVAGIRGMCWNINYATYNLFQWRKFR
jgi:hypothetical protein